MRPTELPDWIFANFTSENILPYLTILLSITIPIVVIYVQRNIDKKEEVRQTQSSTLSDLQDLLQDLFLCIPEDNLLRVLGARANNSAIRVISAFKNDQCISEYISANRAMGGRGDLERAAQTRNFGPR